MPPPRLPIPSLLSRLRSLRPSVPPLRPLKSAGPTIPPNLEDASRILVGFAKLALVLHITVTYIGSIGPTTGISMLPALPHHYSSFLYPYILTSKLHRRGRNIQVGDIVVYAHPMMRGSQGAKRVIGMPGDYVCVLTPGKREEDFANENVKGGEVREEMIQVPEGHCWLAGDNLEWSRDSRIFGPVPLGMVRGKVLAVLWPWGHRKWFRGAVVDPQEEEPEWVLG